MIPAALLCAFIDVESGWRKDAFLNDRNGGSYGLVQIDLSTALWAGFDGAGAHLYPPRVNLGMFAKIIAKLALDLAARGKYTLANLAAAYNAGLAHVLDGGTDKAYSAKIIEAYAFYANALACEMPDFQTP